MTGDSFRESGPVNNIGEQLESALRQIGKPRLERGGRAPRSQERGGRAARVLVIRRDLVGMEMPETIERRRHDEQVHQMAVIGNEVVQEASPNPPWIAEVESQTGAR